MLAELARKPLYDGTIEHNPEQGIVKLVGEEKTHTF
jgi:hypothetical protein